MTSQSCVGVFWDIENCGIPSGMPGGLAAERVKAAVKHFGKLIELNAYGDVSMKSIAKNQAALRSAGVYLIHTPHNAKKQVADMRIIADIVAFALDRSERATIVLISGDGDFAHAISLLQDRGHEVWIISPHFSTSSKLSCRADGMMSWRYDVLERKEPYGPGAPCVADFSGGKELEEKAIHPLLPDSTNSAFDSTRNFNYGSGELSYIQSGPASAIQTCSSSFSAASRSTPVQTSFLSASPSGPTLLSSLIITSTSSLISSSLSCAASCRAPSSPPIRTTPATSPFSLLIKVLRELRASDPAYETEEKKLRRRDLVRLLRKRDQRIFSKYDWPKAYMLAAQAAGIVFLKREEKGAPQFVYLHPDHY